MSYFRCIHLKVTWKRCQTGWEAVYECLLPEGTCSDGKCPMNKGGVDG